MIGNVSTAAASASSGPAIPKPSLADLDGPSFQEVLDEKTAKQPDHSNTQNPIQHLTKAVAGPSAIAQSNLVAQALSDEITKPQRKFQAAKKDINDNTLLAQAPDNNYENWQAQLFDNAPAAVTPKNVVNEAQKSNKLDVTPFQLFMDKAVDALENISQMEFKVNDLIDGYIQGKVSIDEVTIAASKLSLAVSFITTAVTTATQTLKELQQMQI
ncbi:MAG: hypothetical protein AB7F28_01625 [Candidatus Margulisiibacteriota bacterium]